MKKVFVTVLLLGFLFGCHYQQDEAMNEQTRLTRETTAEAQRQVGMPGITNFQERRLVAYLYELRDQEINTFTYIRDFEGRLWHLCDSMGYGIPYSAQFTNPKGATRVDIPGAGWYEGLLPQPEPNGLYLPTEASATWVICVGADGEFHPVYEESEITVSPFELDSVGSYTKE